MVECVAVAFQGSIFEGKVHGARWVVSWHAEGCRFHYHSTDLVGLEPEPEATLYKNSLAKYGSPGYFDTRRLAVTSLGNIAMIARAQLVARQDGMAAAALEEAKAKDRADCAERADYASHRERVYAIAARASLGDGPSTRYSELLDALKWCHRSRPSHDEAEEMAIQAIIDHARDEA